MAWYRILDRMSAMGQVGAAIVGGTATGGAWFYGMRILVRTENSLEPFDWRGTDNELTSYLVCALAAASSETI